MMYVYALVNRHGTIKYIGKTKTLGSRIDDHRKEKHYWRTFKVLAIVEDSEVERTEGFAICSYDERHPGVLENKYFPLRIEYSRKRRRDHAMAITAIPTQYAGYKFRSRLEARWAVAFDEWELDWNYEDQGYYVDTDIGRIKYLPDFWLSDSRQWVEVKGYLDPDGMHRLYYLACAMAKCGDDGADIAVLGDMPRRRSILWPAQLHFHDRLWAVPWSTEPGCPLARPRVAVEPTADMAQHLTDGFPFGHPDWAEDALDRARQARFEWGEHG